MPPNSKDSSPPDRLVRLQAQFAGHIRDPRTVAPPAGTEDRRLAVYRRLVFGNLNNLFAKNFPVLFKLIDETRWRDLIGEFLARHRASTPMFTEIGREFVRFLEEAQPAGLPRFSLELAHWEYLETCVRLAEADPNDVECDPAGDLLVDSPVLNPTLRLAQYRWPVHEISPSNRPEQPLAEPLILAAWRKPDDRPGFMRLNAVTGRLLALIEAEPARSGRAHLESIAGEMRAPEPQAVVRSGQAMLERLRDRTVILGTRQDNAQ